MTTEEFQQKLGDIGWKCKITFLTQLLQNGAVRSCNDVVEILLKTDIKEFGDSVLTSDILTFKELPFPAVVQVQSIKDVCSSKHDQYPGRSLLLLTLNDGVNIVQALIPKRTQNLSDECIPGEKLLLKEGCAIAEKYLFLVENQYRLLGGEVEHMKKKWMMKKKSSDIKRVGKSNSKPPPWVPFGSRLEETVAKARAVHSENASKLERALDIDLESIFEYGRRFDQRFDRAENLISAVEDRLDLKQLARAENSVPAKPRPIEAYYIPEWATQDEPEDSSGIPVDFQNLFVSRPTAAIQEEDSRGRQQRGRRGFRRRRR